MFYDAILIVSFGGPERTEDVIPFLENVLRGRNVPRARLLEVAEHYYHVGGRSPINDQCRDLIAALRERVALPVYWGNAAQGEVHIVGIRTNSSWREYSPRTSRRCPLLPPTSIGTTASISGAV
jgi:hypothetical protein